MHLGEQLVPELVGCRDAVGICKACKFTNDQTFQLGPNRATGLPSSNADHARTFVTCRKTAVLTHLTAHSHSEKFRNSFS